MLNSVRKISQIAKIIAADAQVFWASGKDGHDYPEIFFEPSAPDCENTGRTTEISEGGYGDCDMRIYFYVQINGGRTRGW